MCGLNGTNLSKEAWTPQWPPPHLPYGCLTKAIRQASWLPNTLAGFKSPGGGRTSLKERFKQPPNFKSEDFSSPQPQVHLRCSVHTTFKVWESKGHPHPVSRLPFCFVQRFLKIESNKFHAWQLTAVKEGAPEMHLFIYWGWGREVVMFPVLDALYFADLWGLISAEFFNSWDDRDVHYPNGQHSLLIRAPLSHLICHPIVSHLPCSPYERGIFFQALES